MHVLIPIYSRRFRGCNNSLGAANEECMRKLRITGLFTSGNLAKAGCNINIVLPEWSVSNISPTFEGRKLSVLLHSTTQSSSTAPPRKFHSISRCETLDIIL